MKLLGVIFFLCLGFSYCHQSSQNETIAANKVDSIENFFPVTSFIKGELAGMNRDGNTPIAYYTLNGRKDSSWVKPAEFNDVFGPFLQPQIDSVNMNSLFTETKFLDQTLNTFTFTYSPIKKLPVNMALQRWDVYLDANTNNVQRIYWLKFAGDTTQQLTWNAGENAKIISVLPVNGKDSIVSETFITWRY
ncbi:MAG: hypothetical protein ABIT96_08590 [Ferruginibacter sp.]